MKRSKFLAFLLVLFVGCILTACGGDDDDDGGGSTSSSGTLNISGQSSIGGFDYALWYYHDEKNTTSENEVWCTLEFCSYDYLSYLKGATSLPETESFVSIDILAGNTVPTEIPTGDFFLEYMDCVINCDPKDGSGGDQYEDYGNYEGNVSISKKGNKYTVKVTNAKLKKIKTENESNTLEASFSFTGEIQYASQLSH